MTQQKEGFYFEDGTSCSEILDGKGIYVYENNDIYKGQFLKSEFHGLGHLTMQKNYIYRGYFRKGKIHGKGILTNESGYKVFGIWANDIFKEHLENEPKF